MARIAVVLGAQRLAGAILAAALKPVATPLITATMRKPSPTPRDLPFFVKSPPKRRFTSRERKGRWPGTLGKLRP